jgi:hypothetical protein
MEGVNASFILYPEHDQKATGHTQGEAQDVDTRKSFIADHVAPGNEKIVFDHMTPLLSAYSAKKMPLLD